MVSALVSINEVNLHQARLVLRWATGPDSIPGAGHLFRCVTNQPPRPTQPSIPPGSVNEYQLRYGKAKAGMVHSVSGYTRGVQVKL